MVAECMLHFSASQLHLEHSDPEHYFLFCFFPQIAPMAFGGDEHSASDATIHKQTDTWLSSKPDPSSRDCKDGFCLGLFSIRFSASRPEPSKRSKFDPARRSGHWPYGKNHARSSRAAADPAYDVTSSSTSRQSSTFNF